jgi:cytochrome P450
VTTSAEPNCPVSQPDALAFDPALKQVAAQAPVARIRLPYGSAEAWLVTRYEDVRTVVTDHRVSRAGIIGRDYPRMTPEPIVQNEAINLMDPPAYTRLRRLVSKGFTRRHVAQMRPRIQQFVHELLDRMTEHGSPADLVDCRCTPSAKCWTSPPKTAPGSADARCT